MLHPLSTSDSKLRTNSGSCRDALNKNQPFSYGYAESTLTPSKFFSTSDHESLDFANSFKSSITLAALRENYFLDDGAYLIAKILMKAAQMHEKGQSVADIISDLKEAKESSEYRIKIKEEDFKAYAAKVIEDLKEFAKSRLYSFKKFSIL